jgi:hypothetical protein
LSVGEQDGAVGVLRAEEFDERHCYGDEDCDGDCEGEGARYNTETTDAGFEMLV